jgi:PAP_fibrillin
LYSAHIAATATAEPPRLCNRHARGLRSDFATLDGRWKLLYSSNIFGVGRLSPLTLNEVYQVIDTAANSVKNIAYATLSPPMFGESRHGPCAHASAPTHATLSLACTTLLQLLFLFEVRLKSAAPTPASEL